MGVTPEAGACKALSLSKRKVEKSDPAKKFWWICSVPFSWTWHAAQADVLTASYLCALAVMRSIDASAKEGSKQSRLLWQVKNNDTTHL